MVDPASDVEERERQEPASLRATLCWSAALFAAVMAAFAPALGGEFLNWDDPSNLLENPHFRGLSGEHLTWMFTTSWLGPYQPLSWLSLGIDHALWGLSGPQEYPEAPGYHLTSVVLHAATAVAFFCLGLRLFARVWPERSAVARRGAAGLAALVFAVHPLRAESVVWVTERRDVLSGLSFVLAAWAWLGWAPRGPIGARPTRLAPAALCALGAVATFFLAVDLSEATALGWGALGPAGLAASALLLFASARAATGAGGGRHHLALCFFLLSLLSKGTGVMLPVALLVLDAWPLGRLGARGAGRPRRVLALLAEKSPWWALSVVFGVLAVWGQRAQGVAVVGWAEHTLAERVTQCLYGLAWYPWKTIVPAALVPIVELPPEVSLARARFLVPALGVLLTTALLLLRRARLAGAIAALGAFAILVFPVLGLSQTGPQLVADRYGYLPCMPLALLAGGAFLVPAGRVPARALVALGLLWSALLAGLTYRQARVWTTSERLWEHALAAAPESPAAHQFLAVVRRDQAYRDPDPARKRARLHEALELLERGYAIGGSPGFLGFVRDVRRSLAGLEPEARAEHQQAAVDASRGALAGGGATFEMRREHARLLVEFERYGEALGPLEELVEERPAAPIAWRLLGVARFGLRRYAESEAALQRSLELAPNTPAAWVLLARAREGRGRLDAAVEAYRGALAIEPRNPAARAGLRRLGVDPDGPR